MYKEIYEHTQPAKQLLSGHWIPQYLVSTDFSHYSGWHTGKGVASPIYSE